MFSYNAKILKSLEKSISSNRLSTYLDETGGDTEKALKLYLWDSEISSAFYMPLQNLEITLRNALHETLCNSFSRKDWHEEIELDDRGKRNISDAKKRVRKSPQTVNSSHVVAELSFGFWLSLMNKKYSEKLWFLSLRKAFPNTRLNRAEIRFHLDHLKTFRNRIAHHEPIFKRHLEKDYKSIITAIEWICPDTASWTDHHSKVIDLIETNRE